MNIKYLLINLLLVSLLVLPSCKNPFRYTDAREVPVDAKERVRKNIEEGRGISFGRGPKGGGVFDFASSNELWRASIEVLDFVSFTNASYSGGILITDWFSGNANSEENSQRDLKITVRFLSNEIRADGIKVIIHEKICSDKSKLNCNINKIKSSIGNDIKLAILKKAALLKKESEKKTKK
mgnify:FL=1|tara:strand:- start:401 stop:943 length:543 start_codon:yes stop_codon:yes gene_type:complete